MVGFGILFLTLPLAANVHSGMGILLCWLLAGLISVLGAWVNAGNGSSTFLNCIRGLIFRPGVTAIAALLGAEAWNYILSRPLPVSWLAAALFLSMELLQKYARPSESGVHRATSVAKGTAFFLIISLLFYFGNFNSESFCWSCLPGPMHALAESDDRLVAGKSIAVGTLGALFAYQSFAANQQSSKKKILGVLSAGLFYLLLNVAILYAGSVEMISVIAHSSRHLLPLDILRLNGATIWIRILAILIFTFCMGFLLSAESQSLRLPRIRGRENLGKSVSIFLTLILIFFLPLESIAKTLVTVAMILQIIMDVDLILKKIKQRSNLFTILIAGVHTLIGVSIFGIIFY